MNINFHDNSFHEMSENNYTRPAQIPIISDRFNYLVNLYQPDQNCKWLLIHHPNHLIIYDASSKYCLFDAEYTMLGEPASVSEEESPIVAVITQIRINQDISQFPCIEDDFGLLVDLILREL